MLLVQLIKHPLIIADQLDIPQQQRMLLIPHRLQQLDILLFLRFLTTILLAILLFLQFLITILLQDIVESVFLILETPRIIQQTATEAQTILRQAVTIPLLLTQHQLVMAQTIQEAHQMAIIIHLLEITNLVLQVTILHLIIPLTIQLHNIINDRKNILIQPLEERTLMPRKETIQAKSIMEIIMVLMPRKETIQAKDIMETTTVPTHKEKAGKKNIMEIIMVLMPQKETIQAKDIMEIIMVLMPQKETIQAKSIMEIIMVLMPQKETIQAKDIMEITTVLIYKEKAEKKSIMEIIMVLMPQKETIQAKDITEIIMVLMPQKQTIQAKDIMEIIMVLIYKEKAEKDMEIKKAKEITERPDQILPHKEMELNTIIKEEKAVIKEEKTTEMEPTPISVERKNTLPITDRVDTTPMKTSQETIQGVLMRLVM